MTRLRSGLVVFVALGLVAAGCADDEDDGGSDDGGGGGDFDALAYDE